MEGLNDKNMFCSNCKLSCVQKKKTTRNKKRYFNWLAPDLVEQSSRNNLLNSGILKRVNWINWGLKFSMKSTKSSLNICFTFKAWFPYSCKGRRTCLRRCFKEDFKALDKSINFL